MFVLLSIMKYYNIMMTHTQ